MPVPEPPQPPPRSAVVAGGSLGGLTAALLLRDLGWEVDVFERSPSPLVARGVGIVAHPATVRYLVERGATDLSSLMAESRSVRYMDERGNVVHERPVEYRFTSYYALYRELLSAFDADRYHLDREVVAVDEAPDAITVRTADGRAQTCALVVFADGARSRGRTLVAPEARPLYAGYIAWRGVVGEQDLSPQTFGVLNDAITYCVMHNSHILVYPIPNTDGAVEPGRRLINWIWYRNLPEGPALDEFMTDRRGVLQDVSIGPGGVPEARVDELRQTATGVLAPPLAEAVAKTEFPFVQKVVDIAPRHLASQRACLIGDAAFVLRPHVAVGTAKAAQSAWALARAIEENEHDPVRALRAWEPAQLELERSVLMRTQDAGRRSQFDNSWNVGDPLPFGLVEEGDSVMSLSQETT